MNQRIELTKEQIAQAKRLRSMGRHGRMDWARVAKAMGVSASRLRAHFEAGYSDNREAAHAVKSKYRGSPTSSFIPQHVLEDRDKISAQPQSLTALLLGDPLPGRSALDKRRLHD